MEFITIKRDENLSLICDHIGVSKGDFINKTLNYLNTNDWIADSSDEWEKTVGQILEEENAPLLGISILCLGSNDPIALSAFNNLKIIGHWDCPECGGDLDYWMDGAHGEVWQNSCCNYCGYRNDNEPDFDRIYETNKGK